MTKETFKFIQDNIDCDVKKLALKKNTNPNIDIHFALEQIAAKKIAAKKIPTWCQNNNIIYPTHISLEQCSSELTAKYKASYIAQNLTKCNVKCDSIADLTGGFGIDSYFITQNFICSTYVEMNEKLCLLAENNFNELRQNNITVHNTTAEEYLKQLIHNKKTFSAIYLDPHRRSNSGKKVFSIADCTPNIVELKNDIFNITNHLFIKLSPMLDITQAIKGIGNVRNIAVVSLQNECKEVIIHSEKNYYGKVEITCTNIINTNNTHELISTIEEEKATTTQYLTNTPSQDHYLYEPNASIMKAGFFKTCTKKWDCLKLQEHSHLYYSSSLKENFQGRVFQIISTIPFSKKATKEIHTLTKQANVITRNFPLSADTLRDKLKIKDGGDYFIIGTTLYDSTKQLIIAKRI